jgi:hypothetical protein
VLDCEVKRTACALQLYRTAKWSQVIWRTTVFDQLAHLAGLDFLSTSDLFFSSVLKEFANLLDDALYEILSESGIDWIILSAFSHVPCRAKANLNALLEEGRFLQLLSGCAVNAQSLTEAVEAIAAKPLRPDQRRLVSMESRIDTLNTLAASPVSGSIWVNRADRFEDGAVAAAAVETVKSNVREFLSTALEERFNSVVKVEENPSGGAERSLAPDFIVAIDGIEFHNLIGGGAESNHLPRTTHAQGGFVLSNSSKRHAGSKIEPTEVAELFY